MELINKTKLNYAAMLWAFCSALIIRRLDMQILIINILNVHFTFLKELLPTIVGGLVQLLYRYDDFIPIQPKMAVFVCKTSYIIFLVFVYSSPKYCSTSCFNLGK